MKKIDNKLVSLVILFILNSSNLFSSTYNEELLEVFSKIAPRLVVMSNQTNDIRSDINICVVNDPLDDKYGSLLIHKIQKNYPNGVKNYKLKLINTNYSGLNACQQADIAIMFDTDDQSIEKSLKFFNRNRILTFSYNPKYLEYGVGVTLYIGKKVVPYINLDALRKNRIELDNTLIQISKIYGQEER